MQAKYTRGSLAKDKDPHVLLWARKRMVLKESMREKLTEVEVVIPTPLYVLSISLGRQKTRLFTHKN